MFDFTSMTSVTNMTQTMKLKASWDRKKPAGGSALSGLGQNKTVPAPDLSQYRTQAGKDLAMKKYSDQQLVAHMQEDEQKRDEKLSNIMTKVQSGGNLSPDEMEYLKDKNPMVYQQLMGEKADEEAFERRIRQAKTKDEVQQARAEHSMKAMSTVNSVKNNPYISDSDKAAIMGSEVRKERKVDEALQKFIKSGEYDKLPTQAEVNEAEKEIREAKERELEDQTKPIVDETTEEETAAEKAQKEEAVKTQGEQAPENMTERTASAEAAAEEAQKEGAASGTGNSNGQASGDGTASSAAAGQQDQENELGTAAGKRAGRSAEDEQKAHEAVSFESKREQRQNVKDAETTPEALKLKHAKRKTPEAYKKRREEGAQLNFTSTAGTTSTSAAPDLSGGSSGIDISV